MSEIIELENVSKVFKSDAGEFHALKPLDLSIEAGEYIALIGQSGSGKSTLLNLISGIDHPSTGSIRVKDTNLEQMNESQLARFRGSNVGIVFQFFQLIPTLTAVENVVLAMDLVNSTNKATRQQRALALLDQMGMAKHANKLPACLSGGEQQRVAIARALANDPPILVADEPTGNLDSVNSELISSLFGHCVAEGRTVLVATHERTDLDKYGRVLRLSDGEMVDSKAQASIDPIREVAHV